jgi:hypothetical protein
MLMRKSYQHSSVESMNPLKPDQLLFLSTVPNLSRDIGSPTENSFIPIVPVEDFFSSEQSLPLFSFDTEPRSISCSALTCSSNFSRGILDSHICAATSINFAGSGELARLAIYASTCSSLTFVPNSASLS